MEKTKAFYKTESFSFLFEKVTTIFLLILLPFVVYDAGLYFAHKSSVDYTEKAISRKLTDNSLKLTAYFTSEKKEHDSLLFITEQKLVNGELGPRFEELKVIAEEYK